MRFRSAAFLGCATLLSLSNTAWAELPCDTHTSGEMIYLPAPLLEEISGLARSHVNAGVYWAHTDSGGKAELYALNIQGEHLATVHLQGVTNIDWEDIAVGPCTPDELKRACIFIGDTGDNTFTRTDKKILVFEDPVLPTDDTAPFEISPLYTIAIAYPETAQTDQKFINPDCESLMVDPRDGGIYIVSKQSSGGEQTLYHVSPSGNGPERTSLLTPLASYTFTSELGAFKSLFNAVTAADFSPDGTHFVVRTYAYIYEYDVAEKSMAEAFSTPTAQFSVGELQGEAIAYSADGLDIISAAEKYENIAPYPLMHVSTCVPHPTDDNGNNGNNNNGDNGDNGDNNNGDNGNNNNGDNENNNNDNNENNNNENNGENNNSDNENNNNDNNGENNNGDNGNSGNNENQDPPLYQPNQSDANASHGSCHATRNHAPSPFWLLFILAWASFFFLKKHSKL